MTHRQIIAANSAALFRLENLFFEPLKTAWYSLIRHVRTAREPHSRETPARTSRACDLGRGFLLVSAQVPRGRTPPCFADTDFITIPTSDTPRTEEHTSATTR